MKRKTRFSAVHITETLALLKARAIHRCEPLGHDLGIWTFAKKKHGSHVQKAMCRKCGEMVFLLPVYAHSKEHPQVPAIKGDPLFELCAQPSRRLFD